MKALRSAPLLALLLAAPALADEVPPDTLAKINHDKAAEMARIKKEFKGKKDSELSAEERQRMIDERSAAEQKVLDKYGVSAKDYSTSYLRQSKEERAATDAAEKALAKKDKAAQKKAAAKDQGIQIDRGSSQPPSSGPTVDYVKEPESAPPPARTRSHRRGHHRRHR